MKWFFCSQTQSDTHSYIIYTFVFIIHSMVILTMDGEAQFDLNNFIRVQYDVDAN